MTMRVYVFGTRGFPGVQGGVEQHCESLYSRLADWCDITVFRRKKFINKHHSSEKYSNIKFIDLFSPGIQGIEALFHSLICCIYCILKRPDIVHIHNIGPGLFTPVLKLFGLKVILTYHSPNYEHDKWSLFAKIALKIGEILSLTFSDKVIFVSKNQMMKLTFRNNYIHIKNGVDFRFCHGDEFIRKYGLEDKKYLLCVGRFSEEKGLHLVIEALSKIDLGDFKAVIAGDSDIETEYGRILKEKALNNKNIVLTGFIKGESLYQIYSHAKLFILPSLNEGLPLALLEAMSYNLDVLVSDIPANCEMCLDSDDYFVSENVSDLADKIQTKITGSKLRLFKEKLKNEYNWDKCAIQIYHVYKTL